MKFFSEQTDEIVNYRDDADLQAAERLEQDAHQACAEAERAYRAAWAEAVRGFEGVQAAPRPGSPAYTWLDTYSHADTRWRAAARAREVAERRAKDAAAESGYRAGRRYFEAEILPLIRQLVEVMASYDALRAEVREKSSAVLGELGVPSHLTAQAVEEWVQQAERNGTFGNAGRTA